MKNGPASWNPWVFALFLIVILGTVVVIVAFGGQWFAGISAMGLLLAMATGKHDFPPMDKGQIIMGVLTFVIVAILFFVTQ